MACFISPPIAGAYVGNIPGQCRHLLSVRTYPLVIDGIETLTMGLEAAVAMSTLVPRPSLHIKNLIGRWSVGAVTGALAPWPDQCKGRAARGHVRVGDQVPCVIIVDDALARGSCSGEPIQQLPP
ncbi:hypothetical protein THSYN_29670 (plasmid) [Candidatus Thiodictyon syntrophicum]|uniref:Uncharacterized protein n=1 Tax=Candidatus Thiodictyon syntrophicum TaxID=1166950 RepID=A0A2K8UIU9_9GAMM|nr:hypothetical protein THSYN_29670 [Candidatus Thiodictyon syntrophicum]